MVVLWGSNWSLMKIGLRSVPPIPFALQRFAISAVAMLPAFIMLRRRMPRDKRTLAGLMLLCLLFVLIIMSQAIGLTQESSGLGAVLTYTQPLFVYCLAVPLLEERITITKIAGIVVGFGGVLVLFLNKTGSVTFYSALIMLFAAFLWALSVMYYKKYLNHVDPFVTHFLQLAFGVLPLTILSVTAGNFVFPMDATYVWLVLYSSVGALAIGNVIWFFLLKEEEATTLSGSSLIIPVVAMFFGWQLLGEGLGVESLFGSTLTLIGVGLINLKRRNAKMRETGRWSAVPDTTVV